MLAACACSGEWRAVASDSELVLLHTADLHSHLFPHEFVAGELDQARGLGLAGERVTGGGVARLAGLIRRERAAALQVLHLDSGDLWQGARVYEQFGGEAELAAAAALGVDAQVVGNHELDDGFAHFAEQYAAFAGFPVLAANHGGDVGPLRPWVVLQAGALRVAVIGVAHEAGLVPRPASDAAQHAIDAVSSQADVIVALTHLGLDEDRALVKATAGLDVVLGGHQHLGLDDVVSERDRLGRRVRIAHSGAYGRYLGRLRLQLVARPGQGLEVAAHDYRLLPVDDTLSDDPTAANALARFATEPGDPPIAFVPEALAREDEQGGDAPLGNLVAEAALAAAPAHLVIIPSSSLRADLSSGVLTADSLYRALPFADPLLRVTLSGRELAALFAALEERARRWECRTPIQLAGARLELDCAVEHATGEWTVQGRAVEPLAFYALTTTRYFLESEALTRSGALVADTLRDAVETWLRGRPRCARGGLLPCAVASTDGRIRLEGP